MRFALYIKNDIPVIDKQGTIKSQDDKVYTIELNKIEWRNFFHELSEAEFLQNDLSRIYRHLPVYGDYYKVQDFIFSRDNDHPVIQGSMKHVSVKKAGRNATMESIGEPADNIIEILPISEMCKFYTLEREKVPAL